jgi:DNA-binding NarL/FixJ family response regulator
LFDHSRALCAIAYRKCSENRYDIDPDAQEQRTTKLELSIQQPALLIVEDHAPMRAALRDLLALCGRALHVLEAADGAAAMRAITEHRPSLLLTDVGLPDTTGIELTRTIKALAPATAVIVMSVQNGPQIAERALAAGAAEFIAKDRIFTELPPLIARLDPLRNNPE